MTPCPTPWSPPSPAPLPKSTDPAFVGYIIEHDLNKWASIIGGTPKIISPSVRQMAFDHISIPAMSAETERVFSDIKIFMPESRNRLGPAVIEALEYVRRWVLAGL